MPNLQDATVLDLLSEGPIYGLVNAEASVYLDGTPILDEEDVDIYGNIRGTATYSAGATSVTFVPDSAAVTLSDIEITEFEREIIFHGATQYTSVTIADNVLTASSATWTSADVGRHIKISGAPNGIYYTSTITKLYPGDSTKVYIKNSITTNHWGGGLSAFRVILDEVRTITNISGSSITLNSAISQAPTSSPQYATISAISDNLLSQENTKAVKNYPSALIMQRPGTVDQPAPGIKFGGGDTSFAYNPSNQEIIQASRDADPFSPGTGIGAISGSDPIVVDGINSMGIPDPSTISKLKINLKFPALQIIKNYDDGQKTVSTGVEFQIYLEILQNGEWWNVPNIINGKTRTEENSSGTTIQVPNTLTAAYQDDTAPYYGHSNNYIYLRDPIAPDLEVEGIDNVLARQVSMFAVYAIPSAGNHNGIVSGRREDEFVHAFVLEIPEEFGAFDNFRVRIKRVTNVNKGRKYSHQVMNQSFLQAVFAYSTDKVNFSNSAMAGVRVDSSDFQRIPQRAYLTRGLLVQVPTNYVTREEASDGIAKYTRNISTGVQESSEQFWDGKMRGDIKDTSWRDNAAHPNYRKVYTNNPAWVYYDILINDRYGLGEYISKQKIDIYSLYSIARYCDELVPDGKGGLEPRFTCNIYLQNKEEAYKIITQLASIFRGVVTWQSGQIGATQDAPKAPIYTFSAANIIGGNFSYETSSQRLRTNRVLVTWNNPEKFYKKEQVIIEDQENVIKTNRYVTKDLVALGCTSERQAWRLGKWTLLTEKLEYEVVNFKTGINGTYLRPGDIFYVQDKNRTNSVASGRVASSASNTTTQVYLDRAVNLETSNYQLNIAFPRSAAFLAQNEATINSTKYYLGDEISQAYLAGSPSSLVSIDTEAKAVNALDDSGNYVSLNWNESVIVESKPFSSGSTQSVSSITVSSAFSSAPTGAALFSIVNLDNVNTALGGIKYRTLAVSENEDKTIEVSGALYIEEKFDAVDRSAPVKETIFEPLPTFDRKRVPAPSSGIGNITRTSDLDSLSDTPLYFSYTCTLSWLTAKDSTVSPVIDYPYVDYYEISHNFTPDGSYEVIRTTNKNTFYTFTSFVKPENTEVFVRTVNSVGRKSKYLKIPVSGYTVTADADLRFGGLSTAKSMTTTMKIESTNGAVSFGAASFDIIGPKNQQVSLTGVSDLTLGSPGLSDGNYAYIVYDASAGQLKLWDLYLDQTASDPSSGMSPPIDEQYFIELNSSTPWTSIGELRQDIAAFTAADTTPTVGSNSAQNYITVSLTEEVIPSQRIRIGSGQDAWFGSVAQSTTIDGSQKLVTQTKVSKGFSSAASPYVSIYKLTTQVNPQADFILGRILRTGSAYTLEIFTAVKGASVGTDLVDNNGAIVTDQQITNADDAVAMGFNPAFSEWHSSTLPTGWNDYNSSAANGRVARETTTVLTGSSAVTFTPGGVNTGLYHRTNLSGSGWTGINFSLPNDSVIIGSYDVFLSSGITGNASGILVDLLDSSNNYWRKEVVVPDHTVTNSWQRVYFKASTTDYTNTSGTPPSGDIKAIQIYIMGSWNSMGPGVRTQVDNGTVTFDNLRFQVTTPEVDNNRAISASRDQLIQFNKRYDNVIGPRRLSSAQYFTYKYSGSATTHYVPDIGEGSPYTGSELDTYIDNYVYFFEGATEIARIRLLHVADYFDSTGTSQSDEIRTFYWSFEALNGSGLTSSDFTVENSSVSPVDTMSVVTNNLAITTAQYVGDAAGYVIVCTHNDSGVSSNTVVEIQPVADTVGLK